MEEIDKPPEDLMTHSQKFEERRMTYYGRFSLHHDPEAMVGLLAQQRTLQNDFEPAENSGNFFNTLGKKNIQIEQKVFQGFFYNLDAQINSDLQFQDAEELYEFDTTLGEGSFGQVQKARFKPTDEIMAVKLLKSENPRAIELFQQEAKLLDSFNHPNIIKVNHLILLR